VKKAKEVKVLRLQKEVKVPRLLKEAKLQLPQPKELRRQRPLLLPIQKAHHLPKLLLLLQKAPHQPMVNLIS